MDQETIVITIRDNDPLLVSARRLITDSRLFQYLICELHFTELEMDDFDPDTVALFLTLLEDKTVEEIHERHFRELHKMSVVFEVDWLTEKCSEWLVNKINGIDIDIMEYEPMLYLFEESRYILNKWESSKFVDLLISKLAAMDNTAFISQYTRDFDKLDSKQLDLMLKLGGSNTKLFIEIVLQNVSGKQFFDSNTKHLLGKMNLALCLEQNEHLYDQLFDTLSAMPELTTTDLRYVLKLLKDSDRLAYSRRNRASIITIVYDHKEWADLCNSCNKLDDITSRVEDKRINNMYVVVDILMYVTHLNPPTTEEAEVFVNKLENICQDNPLKKISPDYIDSIIYALKLSPRQEKVQLIALLEKIKNNPTLFSCHDNVILCVTPDKRITLTDALSAGNLDKYLFEFKHPGTAECHMSGKCGFIIKTIRGEFYNDELCTQDTDYNDTGLHLHEIVSAEEMYYYSILLGTTQEGNTVKIPDVWSSGWFPSVSDWKIVQEYVSYNISSYLVAKQD